ncbi:uncharacterized protein CXorf58 homolog isoform X2 [Oryctolagus cuniculus]|uniref:uncharacterized protein CXorf58 homolog isoform X2 n=1 Tax=Oryctolagus cuniculus TaxID=9986 RepID=UPI000490BB19|nr:uncharacterized protein CXorf58 homolog isoform X2 [Oryctolagus cuniculus]
MDDSSNTSGTTVPKSEKRHPGKVHFADTTETRIFLPFNTETSVRIIQRAWLAYLDKMMFRLLKHTICAVEYRVTHEILKKVSPSEAELVKDPTMKCKVRFRFSGETFPPFIVFKIFHHTEGHGCKYFSGKNMLKPCSEYSSLLDETPASSGGRNNYWRKLNLENIPRTMMIYDILDYAESRVISNRLQKEMKYLLQRPGTEEMRQHQLQIVSEVRYPTSFTSSPSSSRLSYLQSQCKHMGRRSKQAKIKVEKMKKAYKTGKEKPALEKLKTETPTQKPQETIILSTPSFDIVEVKESASDTELEKEEKELFTWCENLHIDKSPSS